MDEYKEVFNPKIHIGKFIYQKYDHCSDSSLRPRITGDLYLRELKIELLNRTGELVNVFGYSLKDKMDALLPLIHWSDFEKTRDVSGWDLSGYNGYRDGWGYEFVCMNESGYPLIKNVLDVLFYDKNKPAYEKLLEWIIENYAGEKELKKKGLVW